MTEIDERKEIRRCVDTGKVIFGEKTAEKNILKANGKLIIVSSKVLSEKKEKIKYLAKLAEIPFYIFNGTPSELGSICGKPFNISTMIVLDKGKSNVIQLAVKQKKTVK